MSKFSSRSKLWMDALKRAVKYFAVTFVCIALSAYLLTTSQRPPIEPFTAQSWIDWYNVDPLTGRSAIIAAAFSCISLIASLYPMFFSDEAKLARERHRVQLDRIEAGEVAIKKIVKDGDRETHARLAQIEAMVSQLIDGKSSPKDIAIAESGAKTTQTTDPDVAGLIADGKVKEGFSLLRQRAEASDAVLENARAEALTRWRALAEMAFPRNVAESLSAYLRVVALAPDDFEAHLNLARIHMFSGDTIGHANNAREAIKLAPDKRAKMAALDTLGDALVKQVDLPGAEKAYYDALAIAKSLAMIGDTVIGVKIDGQAAWDLHSVLHKVGEVLVKKLEYPAAIEAHNEGLAIARALVDAVPGYAPLARALSVSLAKVGTVHWEMSEFGAAQEAFTEWYGISKSLSEIDETNQEAQRDFEVCLGKIGGVRLAQSDLSGAKSAFMEGLDIARKLAVVDHSNAMFQSDLSACLLHLGNVNYDLADFSGALAAYDEALSVASMVAEKNDSNAEAQINLGICHSNVAQGLVAMGDIKQARKHFASARLIFSSLSEGAPDHADLLRFAAQAEEDAERLNA